jgi:hypothetical protein
MGSGHGPVLPPDPDWVRVSMLWGQGPPPLDRLVRPMSVGFGPGSLPGTVCAPGRAGVRTGASRRRAVNQFFRPAGQIPSMPPAMVGIRPPAEEAGPRADSEDHMDHARDTVR